MDEDPWGNPDDKVDVNPVSGRVLNMNLSPMECTLSGDVTGRCGNMLDVGSRLDLSGDENDRSRMQVRVRVYPEPRLYVRCLHSQSGPQVGDRVIFKADALDANMRSVLADQIELRQPAGAESATASCSMPLHVKWI
jgi:hypothetical protein